MTKPYYVLLSAECINDDTGKTKVLNAHFRFASQELWEFHADESFDDLGEEFNEWLQANGHAGWFIDDAPETDRQLKPSEAINPVIVEK